MDSTLDRCFHCGEPAGAGAPRTGDRAFCCSGCEAAAAWIESAGLAGYYRARRTAAPLPEPPAAAALARWDEPAFLDAHARAEDGQLAATFVVEGVRCAACAWLIERALAREPGVATATVNAATSRLALRWDPALVPLSQLVARLAGLGYRVHLPSREDARAAALERRDSLKRLAVAGLGAMQAMMFSEALYFGTDELSPATRDFFRWLTLLVSTPVVFYAGAPFLRGAMMQLRLRAPGMDLLVGASVLLAWGASLAATLLRAEAVYFDAAVMFVFFLLAARHIESEARRRATAALEVLARAQPATALRVGADGAESAVAVEAVEPGDRLRVRAGEAVPVDGRLESEAAELDESVLTGESQAVMHASGELVLAGSVALSRPVQIVADRRAGQSTVALLAELAARASASRPRAARLADRVAGRFVVAMLFAAAAVGVFWAGVDAPRALPATLAVLAATCPCALALAVPAAIASAQAAFARLGALVLDPDAVESLARADTVLFDKTGTLTTGRPQLDELQVFAGSRDEALAAAAALERGVHHPLSALFRPYDDGRIASAVECFAGAGVEGLVGGERRRIGKRAFATGVAGDDDGIWLGDGARAIARFASAEALRPGAGEAVAGLTAQGLRLALLSGDSAPRVAALAARLGIGDWRGRATPAEKLARIRELQSGGRRVAMVGDGVNDAAVLAGADAGIAIAEGAALAQSRASVVLASPGLGRLPALFATARRTRRVMRQNLAWAAAYNLAALPLAAAGLVPPWAAALGMTASSLLVTLNALRLARPAGVPA